MATGKPIQGWVCLFVNNFKWDVKVSVFACAAGRRVYPEHAADQRQLPGAGSAGAESAPDAASGHGGISGTGRTDGETQLDRTEVAFIALQKCLKGLRRSIKMILVPVSLSDGFLSKVEQLDRLNIIHVTGTKGKVRTTGPAPP